MKRKVAAMFPETTVHSMVGVESFIQVMIVTVSTAITYVLAFIR